MAGWFYTIYEHFVCVHINLDSGRVCVYVLVHDLIDLIFTRRKAMN